MPFDLTKLQADATAEIQEIKDLGELEAFRIKYLGRRGIISEAISDLSQLPAPDRPQQGAQLNNLKNTLNDLIQKKTEELKNTLVTGTAKDLFDITMPGVSQELGNKHPITLVIDEICAIFVSMGFHIVEGPEIETEFNNFSALNIPLEHPSRDVFDTFYINSPAVDGQNSFCAAIPRRCRFGP
jgi:phenylalanyl-tRNA synthetase alpha chain